MDITEILNQIIAERDKLNIAIAALQAIGAPKRHGRPPKNLLAMAAPSAATGKRRRRKRNKAQREAQAERMKKYWAERKKQAAVAPGKKSAKKSGKS